VSAAAYVTMAIADLIAMEAIDVAIPSCSGRFAAPWHWAMISVIRMKVIVHVTVEMVTPAEPGTSTDKDGS
jgi:hypothetical protein